jgi:hypothetical protein
MLIHPIYNELFQQVCGEILKIIYNYGFFYMPFLFLRKVQGFVSLTQ